MLVKDIVNEFNFSVIAGGKYIEREVQGVYCCDLLSWVMAHSKMGDAWITVQTHINIVAVASLMDLSCIIIPESIEVDNDTIIKANEEGIPIIATDLRVYDIFKKFYEAGLR